MLAPSASSRVAAVSSLRIHGKLMSWLSLLFLAFVAVGLTACKPKPVEPKPDKAASGEPQKTTSTTGTVASEPTDAKEILIGEVGSMTGPEATFGVSTHQGITMALDELNEQGGVKGRKLKVITLDDQGRPDEAANITTKLITQDGVIAIIGEVASSRSLAMAPIAQNYKIPMVSPSSTNPKVTEQGDYIFRVCFIDPFQGTVMAKFALDQLGLRQVAVMRDMKSDYSVGLADYFITEFQKGGGKVVADESYSAGDIDFRSQLTAIQARKPQAIFIPGYYTEVGLIARQAREMGLKVPLLGGDGWDSPKLFEIGGDAVNGSYISNHYSTDDDSPRVQSFVAKYREHYGAPPDSLAALGYDAMRVLAAAMERAPELTPAAIRDALASTRGFQGVTGDITVDQQRNVEKPAVVLKVVDGKYEYQATIRPEESP